MPTVLRKGPYKFYVYSHEPNEPPHVHIDRDQCTAKVRLETLQIARTTGFSPKDLRKIYDIVEEHQEEFLEAWNGHIGNRRG